MTTNQDSLLSIHRQAPAIGKSTEVTVKHKNGGEHKYSFAPLDEIFKAYKPVLLAAGIYIEQRLGSKIVDGKLYLSLHTYLYNNADEIMADSGELLYPMPSDLHEVGKAATYLRRYQFNLLLAIAPTGEDVDANSEVAEPTDPRIKEIKALIEATNTKREDILAFYKVAAISDLNAEQQADLIETLNIKCQQQAEQ